MIVVGNDTVVAMTKNQLIKVNRSLNDYIHLKEISKLRKVELEVSDSLCDYWKKVSIKSDSLYSLEVQKYKELTLMNESLKNSLKVNKKRSMKTNIGVGVGSILFGIVLGVLLGK